MFACQELPEFVFLAKDSFLHHFSTVTFLGVAVLVGSEFLSGTEIYPLMLFWHLGFNTLSYSSWYLKIFWMGSYPTTNIYSFFCMWIGIFLIGFHIIRTLYFWHFHWSETFKQWKKSVSFFIPILMWVSESHGDSVDTGALPVFIVYWLHGSFWLFSFLTSFLYPWICSCSWFHTLIFSLKFVIQVVFLGITWIF